MKFDLWTYIIKKQGRIDIFRHLKKNKLILLYGIIIGIILFVIIKVDGRRFKDFCFNHGFFAIVKTMIPYQDIRVVEKERVVIKKVAKEVEPQSEDKERIVDVAAGIINKADLLNYSYVMKNFYVVQGSTTLSEQKLNLNKISEMDLTIEKDNSVPQILIFHTHGQEHFADFDSNGKTIVDAGEHLAEILRKQYNFNVMHITESFDLVDGIFDRAKAYDYANKKLDKILVENPSIQVVIDLHRDGVDADRRLVTTVNGKKTAKIMLFNGISYSNADGELTELSNPYITENLAMTYKMFLLGKIYYPEFIRCIYVADYRYCLYHVPRSMLIEAGAQTNTYEEVYNAMEPLAHMINLELTCE